MILCCMNEGRHIPEQFTKANKLGGVISRKYMGNMQQFIKQLFLKVDVLCLDTASTHMIEENTKFAIITIIYGDAVCRD